MTQYTSRSTVFFRRRVQSNNKETLKLRINGEGIHVPVTSVDAMDDRAVTQKALECHDFSVPLLGWGHDQIITALDFGIQMPIYIHDGW